MFPKSEQIEGPEIGITEWPDVGIRAAKVGIVRFVSVDQAIELAALVDVCDGSTVTFRVTAGNGSCVRTADLQSPKMLQVARMAA